MEKVRERTMKTRKPLWCGWWIDPPPPDMDGEIQLTQLVYKEEERLQTFCLSSWHESLIWIIIIELLVGTFKREKVSIYVKKIVTPFTANTNLG